MRSLILFCAFAFLMSACGTSTSDESAETPDSTTVAKYSYSNSFEMGDPAYLTLVRNWNDALEAGNIDEAFSYLADSIHVILANGDQFDTTKDSLRVVVDQMFATMSDIKIAYYVGASVRSLDRDESWVLSVTDESMTNEGGENRVIAHELYRIEEGKIRSIYAYAQIPSEADQIPDYTSDEYLYSGSFEMGNTENEVVVDDFLKAFETLDFSEIGNYFADSVTLFFADGFFRNTVRDTVIADIMRYVENKQITLNRHASMALRSVDLNEEWVLVWIDETTSGPDGEENYILHEAYKLVNGKIRVMRQSAREYVEE
jgi:ketosteroid isomerase-like protein